MSKDYELIVAELKQICDNHGVYLVGTCDSESILSEISIIPKGSDDGWSHIDGQDDKVSEKQGSAIVGIIGSDEIRGDREKFIPVTTNNIEITGDMAETMSSMFGEASDYSKGGPIKGKDYIVGESQLNEKINEGVKCKDMPEEICEKQSCDECPLN